MEEKWLSTEKRKTIQFWLEQVFHPSNTHPPLSCLGGTSPLPLVALPLAQGLDALVLLKEENVAFTDVKPGNL